MIILPKIEGSTDSTMPLDRFAKTDRINRIIIIEAYFDKFEVIAVSTFVNDFFLDMISFINFYSYARSKFMTL